MGRLFTSPFLVFALTALAIPQTLSGGTAQVGSTQIGRSAAGGGCPSVTANWTDNFDDNTKDLCLREATNFGSGSGVTAVEANTNLEISAPAGTTGGNYEGFITKDARDFTGKRLVVRLSSPVAADAVVSAMRVQVDATNYFEIQHSSIGDEYVYYVAGVPTNGTLTENLYWSIRHNSGNNHIIFETSSDGSTWVSAHDIANPLTVTSVKYVFYLYVTGAAGADRVFRVIEAAVQ